MGPNYVALKAALATGGAYAGMTDAEAVSACNAVNVPISVDVPTENVTKYLGVNGLLPTVRSWANTAPTPPTTGLTAAQIQEAVTGAQTFGLMIGPPPLWNTLSMSDPATNQQIEGMVNALVLGGLMPQANATAILAMSQATVSQASLWGWPGGIIENDLVAARAWT
jgi:hypothetical protein